MESENNTQMSEENSQNDNIQTSEDVKDYKELYLKEVENAKNQRNLKQKFRNENEKFKSKQEERREKEMSVQELNSELTAKTKSYEEQLTTYKERDEIEKKELLEKLPEEDREDFSNLSLIQIKKVVKRLTQAKPETLKEVHGAVKTVTLDKPYSQMTEAEKRVWHSQVLNTKN